MSRALILVLGLLSLTACSANRDAVSTMEPSALTGQETYNAACASCHDTGLEGAPVI